MTSEVEITNATASAILPVIDPVSIKQYKAAQEDYDFLVYATYTDCTQRTMGR
jgi:hypothetical protein